VQGGSEGGGTISFTWTRQRNGIECRPEFREHEKRKGLPRIKKGETEGLEKRSGASKGEMIRGGGERVFSVLTGKSRKSADRLFRNRGRLRGGGLNRSKKRLGPGREDSLYNILNEKSWLASDRGGGSQ